MIDRELSEKHREEALSKSLNEWLKRAEVKLLLSMLPKAENEDLVQSLLRACFEQGFSAGEGTVAMLFMKAMLTEKSKP